MNTMPSSQPWAIAIIAARESAETLERTILAAVAASKGRDALIDVLVNGNRPLAQEIAAWAEAAPRGALLRVWSIPRGDKAHAWNEYVHRIWPACRPAFFLDGYAQARPDGLAQLADSLARSPEALGATGVPSCGRSAPALRANMLRVGGLHGNMHVIPASVMAQFRALGFHLPLGLYRTDSLVNAVLSFGLDPATHQWDHRRVVVTPDATWDVPGQDALTLKNVVGHFKRRLRQAQGDLENRAVREHLAVQRRPIHLLPKTARELVLSWMALHPDQARALYRANLLRLHAARKLRAPQDWAAADLPPELLGSAPGLAPAPLAAGA